MTDGLGSKSYDYNQLSQLMSETRVFTGVGTFTLGYDYNLAGELKKITDSTNMTINYGYDSIGRLNGVTGSNNLYAGVSNYASNFQYRAWGGLKSMTDGTNHVSSLAYNSKLQPTQFDISGSVVHQNYDYYNDGRISFVHNTTDSTFDRGYSFDHLGRLTGATSGGVYAAPYYESFGYDAFSDLTARQSDSWNGQTSDFDSASYTNNRRTGWGYDADGRNTTIGTRSVTFNAAGQRTQMTAQQVLWNGNHITINQTTGYDGDGSRVYEVASGVTTHYLRSSVLGGAIIEELNSSGQKKVGYVSLPGGQLLATQTSILSPTVIWKHNKPAGTSEYTMNSGNSAIGRVEFDPLGADISLTQPPGPPPSRDEGEVGPGYSGGIMGSRWSDFFNLDSGFVINGHSESSSYAMSFINFGSGSSLRDSIGATAEGFANAVLSSLGPAVFAPTGASRIFINVSGVEGMPGHQTIEWQWVKYNGQSSLQPIPTAYSGTASMPGSIATYVQLQQPQEPSTIVDNSFDEAAKLLAKSPCRDFVLSLGVTNPDALISALKKVSYFTSPDKYHSKNKGIHAETSFYAGKTWIDFYKPFFTESKPKPTPTGVFRTGGEVPMQDEPRNPMLQGQESLHEGIHVVTEKSDVELANSLLGKGEKPFTDAGKLKASESWHKKLVAKCHGQDR